MRSEAVIMASPLLGENLGFLERLEQLHIQELVAQLAVDALAIALPRVADPPDRQPHQKSQGEPGSI